MTATGLVKPKEAERARGSGRSGELTEVDAELEADKTKALKLSPRAGWLASSTLCEGDGEVTVTAADLARNSTQAKLKVKLR